MRVALGVVLPGANLLTCADHVGVGHVEVAAGVERQAPGSFSPVRVAVGVVLPGANLLTVLLP